MTSLYICISTIYTNILLLCTSRKRYPFLLPEILGTVERVCQRRRFLEVKMGSRGSTAIRRTSVRPFLRLEALPPGWTVPLPVGSHLGVGLSWGLLSASWAVSLVGPDWILFLSLCVINTNLLKIIIINIVYNDGSCSTVGLQWVEGPCSGCELRGKIWPVEVRDWGYCEHWAFSLTHCMP